MNPDPPAVPVAAPPRSPGLWRTLLFHAARTGSQAASVMRRGVDTLATHVPASRVPTAGAIMDQHRGAGPGFDALRFYLSVAIVVYHAKQVVVGREVANYQSSILFPYLLALVPVFFCLSGFR